MDYGRHGLCKVALLISQSCDDRYTRWIWNSVTMLEGKKQQHILQSVVQEDVHTHLIWIMEGHLEILRE